MAATKKSHVKWTGQHITEADHKVGVQAFGPKCQSVVEPLLQGTDLFPRCRLHGKNVPCVYVFRARELAAQDRGLVFHVQLDPKETFVEIIFRRWSGKQPLNSTCWESLQPDSWHPNSNYENWRGLRLSPNDLGRAREPLEQCVARYDEIYG